MPAAAAAQEMPLAAPLRAVPDSSGHVLPSRNEIAVEIGYFSGGVSYARRLGATPLSVGAGAFGGAWAPGSFDYILAMPVGLVAFARYHPTTWLHTDLGVTGAGYLWWGVSEDIGGLGSFVGVRSALLVGNRFLSVGPQVLVGRANSSDDPNGPEFGVLWSVQLRHILGWGS